MVYTTSCSFGQLVLLISYPNDPHQPLYCRKFYSFTAHRSVRWHTFFITNTLIIKDIINKLSILA